MLMPASSEFLALCRSQVALLTQALGASLCIVYMTEELVEGADARLVPVVAYPDVAQTTQAGNLALPSSEMNAASRSSRLLSAELAPTAQLTDSLTNSLLSNSLSAVRSEVANNASDHALAPQRQVILPLMHEGVVLGFLVTARDDRAWNEWECSQIERIAETIAIACVLDQRYQWLEQDRRQQQELQARQHDLMDNLLHQFRNPLTALKTFGKLLLRRLLPSDNNRDVAASIVRESDRLQELLQQFDRVLDLMDDRASMPLLPPAVYPIGDATVTTGATLEPTSTEAASVPLLPASGLSDDVSVDLKPCSIAAVLSPLLASAAAIAQERQLSLQATIPPNLPPVLAQELALREILSNLLDNALKYTPSGGRIMVQAGSHRSTSQGDWQAVSISDTGPGIPPEDLDHIFERHFRGVQAAGDIPGTGLGLAIARELTRQMRGDIQVFSPALVQPSETQLNLVSQGNGTTFVMWLPVAPTAP